MGRASPSFEDQVSSDHFASVGMVLLHVCPHPLLPNLFVPTPTDSLAQLLLTLEELFWRFAAGFANG
jgi:hypothetical protein